MRIIAGKWRSRRLVWPDPKVTRPLPDRVKEAVFNILGHYYETPGALPAIGVADVFAGSGAIGLEALSRGAARCVFFERARPALVALRTNIDAMNARSVATIVTTDAWRAAAGPGRSPVDLFFLDPPYRDVQDDSASGRVRRFLTRLVDSDPPPLVVLHHPAKTRYAVGGDEAWTVLDERTIGSNRITIFTR